MFCYYCPKKYNKYWKYQTICPACMRDLIKEYKAMELQSNVYHLMGGYPLVIHIPDKEVIKAYNRNLRYLGVIQVNA